MQKLILTFRLAIRDARANLMHTVLSVLGIVIGVGALVAILSLIDGMEKYVNNQITQTTSLESIIIAPKTTDRVDNVLIAKDDYAYFEYTRFNTLLDEIGEDSKGYMLYRESGYLNAKDSAKRQATLFSGIIDTWKDDLELIAGRFITKSDLKNKDSVVVLNKVIALQMAKEEEFGNLLEKTVTYNGGSYLVVGILDTSTKEPEVYAPITLISADQIKSKPPICMLVTNSVELVEQKKEAVLEWITKNFEGHTNDFRVETNELRVKQVNQGFLMFRIVMGLIVGISVLVGGIGVMNVLLISVTERTSEIGVRKAVGANKKDIITQFLSESIAISSIGSLLGLLLGIGFTMAAVPIIKATTEIPFEAAYTLNTLLIIGAVALLIGIIFGTYPAMKAAKLDPVDAIRRE